MIASSKSHRLLVAFDALSNDDEILETALGLIYRLRGELMGLCIEDNELSKLARLPFSHTVDLASATTKRFDEERMARLIRLSQKRIQERLRDVTHDIRWTLKSVRGRYTSSALTVENVDLYLLRRPATLTRPKTAKTATAEANPVLLLLGSVHASSVRAIDIAKEIVVHEKRQIVILQHEETPPTASVGNIENLFSNLSVPFEIRQLDYMNPNAVGKVANAVRAHLIILSADLVIDDIFIEDLCERTDRPLLYVKSSKGY